MDTICSCVWLSDTTSRDQDLVSGFERSPSNGLRKVHVGEKTRTVAARVDNRRVDIHEVDPVLANLRNVGRNRSRNQEEDEEEKKKAGKEASR